jgi:hypothetical protein
MAKVELERLSEKSLESTRRVRVGGTEGSKTTLLPPF